LPEAISFESRRHGRVFQHGVVALLGFGRRDVADGLQQPSFVEPVDPGQRGELDRLEVFPWPAPMDDLGLVEAVDRFGESVVVGGADAADGGLDAGFGQSLGVADADILRSPDALLFVKRRCGID
jgi:hypothetical protein